MGKLELNKYTEAEIDRRIEQSFQSHRQAPDGRNVFAFKLRYLDSLGDRYDHTFKGCPDSPEWWDSQFCPGCDKRKHFCICGTGQEIQKEPRFMAPRGVIKG